MQSRPFQLLEQSSIGCEITLTMQQLVFLTEIFKSNESRNVPGLDVHLGEVDDAVVERLEGAAGVEGRGEAAARLQLASGTDYQSDLAFSYQSELVL